MKQGDSILFHDPKGDRPGSVLRINDDGTFDIEYQHPADPAVTARADHCVEGGGVYCISEPSGEAPAAVSAPAENAAPAVDVAARQAEVQKALQAEVENLQIETARITAERDEAKAEALAAEQTIDSLRTEFAALTTETPGKGAKAKS